MTYQPPNDLTGSAAIVSGASRGIGRTYALALARAGAKVLVDPSSMDLLAGSELDFTDQLMGSHFAVRNPNAKSACGCGTSFSVD